MTNARLYMLVAMFLFGALLVVGCSEDDNPVTPDDNAATIVTVYPADGATGITSSASIAVAFSGPVDTSSVMHNLFLTGGQPMQMWRDSLMHYGGFGSMHMGTQTHMMNWLDSIEIAGEFHWNTALDSCEFMPDSGFAPATGYLCLIRETKMHDSIGNPVGGMHHTDNGYHMYEFMTAP